MLLNAMELEKQRLSDELLESKIWTLVNQERAIEKEFLELLQQAENRKIYLTQGYSSLFEWLTHKFKYSEAAAARRVNTIKLIAVVPEIKDKIVEGSLNMTTLSKVQTVIRKHEKISGKKVSVQVKTDIIKSIENKSRAETEKTLFEIFPQVASQEERSRRVDESHTRLSLVLDEKTLEKLKQVKDRLSHVLPDGNFAEVISYLADGYLKKDQSRKPAVQTVHQKSSRVGARAGRTDSAAAKCCVTPAMRRAVFLRAGYECEYVYQGRRCGSSFQLEVDHIYPKALGGEHELKNLRCLCRSHNQFLAKIILGTSH